MLDVNPEDFSASQAARLDEQLMVRFFYKEVQNKLESAAQGRPIFKEKEYIEIRIAGQRDPQACRPATHADKARFPRHYDAFKKRMEVPTEGTPLTEWPLITRSRAEELSFLNAKTVEQVANMGDTQVSQLMGGFTLREQAQKWLEHAGEMAVQEEKHALLERIDQLEAMVASLTPQPAVADRAPETTSADEVATEPTAAKKTSRRRKR